MKQIHISENPKGTFSSEIGITTEEWKYILLNDKITTPNYKEALLAFYREPEHGASCKELSLKYFGNDKDAQKFNSWITRFGIAVSYYLKRFKILDKDDKEVYWNIAINPGTNLPNGLFRWTLRKEIVEAIESLGWNRFSWIPFYMEFADKQLHYKNNRSELVKIIYGLDNKFVRYIKSSDGGHVSDIDPFTIYGIFNRGITNKNRLEIADYFKKQFDIKSALPTDFDGIPVVNNMSATFYSKEYADSEIQPLWDLFESAIKGDREKVFNDFDIVAKQHGIKWNITMGLFWIRPYNYISLDWKNRNYFNNKGIDIFGDKEINSANYFGFNDQINSQINSGLMEEHSIPEVSLNAWLDKGGRRIWLTDCSIGSTTSRYERFISQSTWEGRFNDNNKNDSKLLEIAKTINKGDIIVLKTLSNDNSDKDTTILKIKAIGKVTSDVVTQKADGATLCTFDVNYINIEETNFSGSYSSYVNPIHELNLEHKGIVDYINKVLNTTKMETGKYDNYIQLLKSNKNLVLTGAPGTGKTYMAKEIAKAMKQK